MFFPHEYCLNDLQWIKKETAWICFWVKVTRTWFLVLKNQGFKNHPSCLQNLFYLFTEIWVPNISYFQNTLLTGSTKSTAENWEFLLKITTAGFCRGAEGKTHYTFMVLMCLLGYKGNRVFKQWPGWMLFTDEIQVTWTTQRPPSHIPPWTAGYTMYKTLFRLFQKWATFR